MEDSNNIASEKAILAELKRLRDQPLPTPQSDWDLIWVLSGPELDLAEVQGRRNENRDRILTGFDLARAVTATRLNLDQVNVEDIRATGPQIYFNGTAEHNQNLKAFIESSTFEDEFRFPSQKLEIAQNGAQIIHTGHQFELFPGQLLEEINKIVILSSARHLPRIKRYVGLPTNPFMNFPGDRIIFYPALPLDFPYSGTRQEIKKIPKYQQAGVLARDKSS